MSSGPTCRPVAASITRSGTFLSWATRSSRPSPIGSTAEASSTPSTRCAASPGPDASKNGAGNVTGLTAIPSPGPSAEAMRPPIPGSARTRPSNSIIRLVRSHDQVRRSIIAGSHLRSMVYSVFPSATSTSVFEELGFLYLRGTRILAGSSRTSRQPGGCRGRRRRRP